MTACGKQWKIGVARGGVGKNENATETDKQHAKACSSFILQSVGARDKGFYYQPTFTIISQVAGFELTHAEDKNKTHGGRVGWVGWTRAKLENESNGELRFGGARRSSGVCKTFNPP